MNAVPNLNSADGFLLTLLSESPRILCQPLRSVTDCFGSEAVICDRQLSSQSGSWQLGEAYLQERLNSLICAASRAGLAE